MRTAYKVWSGIAAGVFVIVALTDLSASSTDQDVVPAAAAPVEAAAAPAEVVAETPVASPVPAAGEAVVVTSVVDGDTVEVDGGRLVQVLAVDACEVGTDGGDRATESLRLLVEGEPVTLDRAPGVETDRNGHELRYVTFLGGDLGERLAPSDHTTPYDGHGAPQTYVDGLRALDFGDQVCTDPVYDSPDDVDADIDWPSPGDQGLPDGALTGGYCAKKWWC